MAPPCAVRLVLFLAVTASMAQAGEGIPTSHPLALGHGAGESFQVIYVTDAIVDGTSPDAATYHAVVQGDATAQGVGDVTWKAMVATVNDAFAPANAPQTERVFLSDGTFFRSLNSLYGLGTPSSPPLLRMNGSGAPPEIRHWTGISVFNGGQGVTNPSLAALGLSVVYVGIPDATDNNGFWRANDFGSESILPLYGLSEKLTVGTAGDLAKGRLRASFKKPTSDRLKIAGAIPPGSAVLPEGDIVGFVVIGDTEWTFELNAKGKSAKDPNLKVRVNEKKQTFTVALKKVDLIAALGLVDAAEPKPGVPIEVPWQVTIDNVWSSFGTATFTWTAKEGKKGRGKLAP